MYEKILIAVCSKDEVSQVLAACKGILGTSAAEVHLLSVGAAPVSKLVGDHMDSALLLSQSELDLAREHVTATVVAAKDVFEANDIFVREHVRVGKPKMAIIELAKKLEVDLVILSRGCWNSSISSIWRDFRSAALLRRMNCSFLIVGPDAPGAVQHSHSERSNALRCNSL